MVKVGLQEFPPLLFTGLRYLLVAFPAVLWIPRGHLSWRWILGLGSLYTGFSLCTILGIVQGMPAGLSSLVMQSQALFTLVLSAWVLNDRPTHQQLLGVGISLGGIGLLAWQSLAQAQLGGLGLILLAAIFWAMANIGLKLGPKVNSVQLMVWVATVIPWPLFWLSWRFETGQWQALAHLTPWGWGALLYCGLISNLLSYSLWGHLLHRYSANVVAPFSLLAPISGLFFAGILLGESFRSREAIGSILVFSGLILVTLPKIDQWFSHET
jgi:O-acetylserine/cysteine efflux transporter